MQSLSEPSSCRALLRLGRYWMYLVYPTYSPVYSAQLSASTKRLKLERRGNWPCSPEACWVSSSLTPDKHPPHGWARPHAQQFCCLSSCHWISLYNTLFREREVILSAPRAAVDVQGMKDRAVSQAYPGKAPPLITLHYNWRAGDAESSHLMWELKGQAGTLCTAVVWYTQQTSEQGAVC